MSPRKRASTPNDEIIVLLEKTLILNLFALNVPQDKIAKKLRIRKTVVNDFLRGIGRNGKKETKRS